MSQKYIYVHNQGIGDVPTYWLKKCDEPVIRQQINLPLDDNPIYPLIRSSPSNRRRQPHSTGTPQSHRGSPIALASRFDRTSSLRGSLTHYNITRQQQSLAPQENGTCNPDLEPLMSDYETSNTNKTEPVSVFT